MVTEFKLAEITVEVNEKDIKNVHLSVNPPDGKVRIAIPLGMNLDTVRSFALSKLSWIRQQRKQFVEQEREIAREFLELESHFVFGKRYLLRFVDQEAAPSIRLSHDNLTIGVRPGTTREKIQDALEQWYRDLLRHEALEIIKKWSWICP